MYKYNENDVVRCTSTTLENHEGLVYNALYVVKGSDLIGDDVVYAVQDGDGNAIIHSIDRFVFVGKKLSKGASNLVGKTLMAFDIESYGHCLTAGVPYKITSEESADCDGDVLVGFVGNDGAYHECFSHRFVNIESVGSNDVESLYPSVGELPQFKMGLGSTLEKVDMVNSPNHYTSGGIEPNDFLEAKLTPEQFIGYLNGTAMVYLARAGKKGDALEDFKKAQYYVNRIVATMEKQ